MAHHIANTPSSASEFSTSEISAMAAVLVRRHGADAAGVARHFMVEHLAVGDAVRAEAWRRVTEQIGNPNEPRTLS